MSTSAFIRRHVNSLEEGQMFEILDVLTYGARPNVDFALQELVKKGRIVRLAQGIYMRGDETTPLPKVEEIAAFKARMIGAVFADIHEDESRRLKLARGDQKSNEVVYWVLGAGSSFSYGQYKIVLKTISAKKQRKFERQEALRQAIRMPPQAVSRQI